jgi:hypothetical protein
MSILLAIYTPVFIPIIMVTWSPLLRLVILAKYTPQVMSTITSINSLWPCHTNGYIEPSGHADNADCIDPLVMRTIMAI